MEEQDANWIEECVELLQQLETLNSGRDFSSQSELREFQNGISRIRSQLTERLSGHRLETEVLTPCLDVASVSPLPSRFSAHVVRERLDCEEQSGLWGTQISGP